MFVIVVKFKLTTLVLSSIENSTHTYIPATYIIVKVIPGERIWLTPGIFCVESGVSLDERPVVTSKFEAIFKVRESGHSFLSPLAICNLPQSWPFVRKLGLRKVEAEGGKEEALTHLSTHTHAQTIIYTLIQLTSVSLDYFFYSFFPFIWPLLPRKQQQLCK